MQVTKIKALKDIEKTITTKEIYNYLKNKARGELSRIRFLGQLAESFAAIEVKDKIVTDVVMNSKSYQEFLRSGSNLSDREIRASYIKRGLMAYIWGARVWINNSVSAMEVEVYAEGEKDLYKKYPDIKKAKIALKMNLGC